MVITRFQFVDLGRMTDTNIETSCFTAPFAYDDEYWDYSYDNYSQLTNVKEHGSNIADYTFNMAGNRVEKYIYSGTETIKMLYDGFDCVADYDANTDLQRYYVTPGLDENMILYDVNTNADYFYAQDGLGTIRGIYDTSSAVVNDYDYEGFGTNYGTPTTGIYNRFRYTGREIDKETESSAGAGDDGDYFYVHDELGSVVNTVDGSPILCWLRRAFNARQNQCLFTLR